MNLITAKRIISPLTRDGEKIYPEATNDWTFSIADNWSGGSRIFINSLLLNKRIDISSASHFLRNHVFTSGITFELDKIIGSYAFTKQGFISEEDFIEAQEIVELSKNLVPLKPSELIEGYIYKSDEDIFYVNLGNLDEKVLLFGDNQLTKVSNILDKNDKAIYLAKIDYDQFSDDGSLIAQGYNYIIQKTSKIKLIEEVDTVNRKDLYNFKFITFEREHAYSSSIIYPFFSKEIVETEIGRFNDNLLLFKGSYYLRKGCLFNDEVLTSIPLNEEKFTDNNYKVGYKKIKDIDSILDFLTSNDEKISDIFFDEIYYFQNDNDLDLTKVSFS